MTGSQAISMSAHVFMLRCRPNGSTPVIHQKKKEIYFLTSFLINKCDGVVIFAIKVTQQR
jgi:hypothetical protein